MGVAFLVRAFIFSLSSGPSAPGGVLGALINRGVDFFFPFRLLDISFIYIFLPLLGVRDSSRSSFLCLGVQQLERLWVYNNFNPAIWTAKGSGYLLWSTGPIIRVRGAVRVLCSLLRDICSS